MVQLRRMLQALERIKEASREQRWEYFPNQGKSPVEEMVRTCAEAMLIEVVDEETDPPQTRIRQFLSRAELNKIVYTWADEMQFE